MRGTEKTLESRRVKITLETTASEKNLVLLDKTEIEWTLKKFRQMLESEPLREQTFEFIVEKNAELPDLKWRLKLVFHQDDLPPDSDQYKLDIRWNLLEGFEMLSENKIFYRVRVDILKEDGSVWHKYGKGDPRSDMWEEMDPDEYEYISHSLSKPYDHGDLKKHLSALPFSSDGSLRFHRRFQHFANRISTRFEKEVHPKTLECWLKHLEAKSRADRENVKGKNTDVQIISSDGKTVSFHQLLLVARSPVFEAMFRSEMLESQSGVIKLDDLSEQGVNCIHHFIYDGRMLPCLKKVRDGGELGDLELWIYIASKYQFDDLMGFFDKLLGTLCNEGNAMDLLKLCNRFSLMGAREDVVNFIHRHRQVLYNIV